MAHDRLRYTLTCSLKSWKGSWEDSTSATPAVHRSYARLMMSTSTSGNGDKRPSQHCAWADLKSDDDEDASGLRAKGKKPSKEKKPTKAFASAKDQVELPNFTGKNLDKWAEQFASFVRLTGQVNAPVNILLELIDKCCKKSWRKNMVKQILTGCSTFGEVVVALETMYLKFELNLKVHEEIAKLPSLPEEPTTCSVMEPLVKMDYHVGRLTPSS